MEHRQPPSDSFDAMLNPRLYKYQIADYSDLGVNPRSWGAISEIRNEINEARSMQIAGVDYPKSLDRMKQAYIAAYCSDLRRAFMNLGDSLMMGGIKSSKTDFQLAGVGKLNSILMSELQARRYSLHKSLEPKSIFVRRKTREAVIEQHTSNDCNGWSLEWGKAIKASVDTDFGSVCLISIDLLERQLEEEEQMAAER